MIRFSPSNSKNLHCNVFRQPAVDPSTREEDNRDEEDIFASTVYKERSMTLLMCDIVNSSKLSKSLSSIDLANLLSYYYQQAFNKTLLFGGTPLRCIGDGVLSQFSRSDKAGQNVSSAIHSAQALIDVLRDAHNDLCNLALRTVVVTGVGLPGKIKALNQKVVYGSLPFRADALKKRAKPNSVILDKRSADAVRQNFTLIRTGSTLLRWINRDEEIWVYKSDVNFEKRPDKIQPNFDFSRT